MRVSRRVVVVVLALLVGAGCSSGAHQERPAPAPRAHAGNDPGRMTFTPAVECPTVGPSFDCATLNVPYDRTGRTAGTLGLSVAMTRNADAPKGVLLFLTGGPGQPGVPAAGAVAEMLAPVLDDYRLVMLDQRGTGATALECDLQTTAFQPGAPSPASVTRCAAAIGGNRRFHTTADTVADLEVLRRALGVDRWTIDAVSYGTYAAQRYAQAHPRRVSRLVLDSVVPTAVHDTLDLLPLRAAPRVLRTACAAIACGYDPVADLTAVVRRHRNGPQILDALLSAAPDYREPLTALHEAAAGRTGRLDRLLGAPAPPSDTITVGRDATPDDTVEAREFSVALQVTTSCLDGRFPWGGSDTRPADRRRALDRAAAALTAADYGPFDAATATASVATCLHWPRTPVPPSPPADARLPDVPVLMLGGELDLTTPLEGMEAQRERTPRAETVVVPGGGHTVQQLDAGLTAVLAFLGRD